MQFNPTMAGGGPGQQQDGSMVGGWDGAMGGDKVGGLKGTKGKMGRPKGAKDTKPRCDPVPLLLIDPAVSANVLRTHV